MRNPRLLALPFGFLLFAFCLPLAAQQRWALTQTFTIGGDGGWDYALVDPPQHRLFVTRSTHTQVIDTRSGHLLADIPGQIRSHGTAIVPALNRGFITDGGGNGAILVFDLKTYKVLGKIAALPDADGILYDPASDLVLAVSGDRSSLMTFHPNIDPLHGQIDPPIDLGGAPEFLAADDNGRVYINLENKDLVAVVDLRTRQVIARWPVAPGGHPVGMAIDKKNHLLFVGCRNPHRMIVMSTRDGKIVADLPIGAGVDATKTAGNLAFASCGDGTLTVVAPHNGSYLVQQVVQTAPGARTMDVDPQTKTVYLPTADLLPPAPGEHRPHPKPGSFKILVVTAAH